MVSFGAIFVFGVLVFIIISLYFELLGPSFTFMVGVAALGIAGILTPEEILSGFANEQIAVIIMLLLLGDVIKHTGVIEILFDRYFRYARNYRGFLSRMMIMISGFSAFLNNTPLVALMMPYVHNWCKRNNISPSKFLIPLSYAAILGGCATLIGTSTNLIVNGLVVDQQIIPDLPPLDIFDFVWVGIPMMIIGYVYLIFFSDKLLPARIDAFSDYSSSNREYHIEARVRKKSHLIGKTIGETNILSTEGLYLIEIIRGSYKISAVAPDVVLEADDVLIFTGDTNRIVDLVDSNSGLSLSEVGMMNKRKRSEIIEIVISQNSTIINKQVKEVNFRGKYDAAILSVHRNGEMLKGDISDISLKAGDVLLLYAGEDFISRTTHSQDFYFISKVRDFVKLETYKIVLLLGGTLLAILLSAFNIISLFMGLLIMILTSLALRVTHPKDLPKAIDYNLGMIIVLSLALGTAMIKTGAADLMAGGFIKIFIPFGNIGLLFGIYLITAFLAAYITNKAAVAIIFPISLTMASNLYLNPLPFILVVSYAAAANFMTPIGYQTNLMVYGPGGYSFKDFFKIGFPLTMIYMVATIVILTLLFL